MQYDYRQIEFMRAAITAAYGKGKFNKWTEKCQRMAPQQVIAVYYSFKNRRLI